MKNVWLNMMCLTVLAGLWAVPATYSQFGQSDQGYDESMQEEGDFGNQGDFNRGQRGRRGFGGGADLQERRGFGGPADGQGRGFQDQSRWGQTDPVELMTFLHQYEPELHQKLLDLQQQDPRQFQRQMAMVGRLYGPVMMQMRFDPAIGQVSLKLVRQTLKIEQLVQEYNVTESQSDKDAIRSKLKNEVSAMFDIVIQQEELRLNNWQERLAQWQSNEQGDTGQADGEGRRNRFRNGREGGQGFGDRGRRGPGAGGERGFGRGGDGDRGGRGFGDGNFQERLESRQHTIDAWKSQKEMIVNNRVEELIGDIQPFPWRGSR